MGGGGRGGAGGRGEANALLHSYTLAAAEADPGLIGLEIQESTLRIPAAVLAHPHPHPHAAHMHAHTRSHTQTHTQTHTDTLARSPAARTLAGRSGWGSCTRTAAA